MYLPHVTLARKKGEALPKLEELDYETIEPFTVNEVVLYQSKPGEQTSHYIPLETFQLGLRNA